MASFDYTFTSGDTVTPTKLNSARNVKDIVNADIKSDAAIAGTKVAPNFGSQNIVTTGSGNFNGVNSIGTNPTLQLTETDAANNNQRWDILAENEGMSIRAVNDAYTAAGNAIEIQRTGTTIDSVSMPNGNVGIGTSSPQSKLEVAGNIHTKSSEQYSGLAVRNATNTVGFIIGSSATNDSGSLGLLNGGTQSVALQASGVSYLNGGNVGINTNNPTSKLTVVDNSANDAVRITQTGGGNALVVEDSANPDATPFVVTADGSIGIGTASPSSAGGTVNAVASSSGNTIIKTQTSSTTTGTARLDFATGTPNSFAIFALQENSASPFFQISAGSAVAASYHNFPQHIFRSTSGSEWMRINGSGNVGIGVALPSTKLEVNGTVTATAFSGNVTGNLTGTASAIADGSVSTAKIVDSNVTTAKIADGNVTAAKLATSAVETAKIADDAVTNDKLSLAANAGEIKKALNADNTPPIYACRAWVNFDGTRDTTGATSTSNTDRLIRASGNVSSVTRIASGVYEINFTTAMPDANYSMLGTSTSLVGTAISNVVATFNRSTDARVNNTAAKATISTCNSQNSTQIEVEDVHIAVFR